MENASPLQDVNDPKILQALAEMEVDEAALLSLQEETTPWQKLSSLQVIAWATHSINLNSVITPPLYIAFHTMDSALVMYLLVSIIYSQVDGIHIHDMWAIESYLLSMSRLDMIIFNSVMISLFITLYSLFFVHVAILPNETRFIDKQSQSKKLILILAVMFETVFKVPILVVAFRNFLCNFDQGIGFEAASVLLSLISLSFLAFHNLIFRRVYTLRINN